MLVPFTRDATALGDRRVGANVNLEVDVIARYVGRLLETRDDTWQPGGVTLELLERQGYLSR
jgi:riboflavin synthase